MVAVIRFLWIGALGAVVGVGALVWDAAIHIADPLARHEEAGLWDLSNPSHLVALGGGGLLVASVVGALVRARALLPRRPRPIRTALAVLLAGGLVATGVIALQRADDDLPQLLPEDARAAELHSSGIVSSHADGPCEPTRADRRGAMQLIGDTARGTARFADYQVALAEGYVPGLAASKTDHWLKPTLMGDGKTLDPSNPEALIYTATSRGFVLTGVTYIMSVAGEFGPEVGGCLTRWHVHANLCFSPVTQAVVGELRPDNTCPSGSTRYVPPPLLHVWFVDLPDGRFAAELDHDALVAIVGP